MMRSFGDPPHLKKGVGSFASVLFESIWWTRYQLVYEGWVKLNFDTAILDSQLIISVVPRNAFSNILLIKTGMLSLIDPTLGEALAVNMVVDYAIDCFFEGDSQVVISELKSFDPVSMWNIVDCICEVRTKSTNLLCWVAIKMPRAINFLLTKLLSGLISLLP
ncbi:hypothetical protein PanWU01x14_074970 [Parasponia andersonii]|uniref:RNase H type-1 domain-containing protein n=1 Tax=Parasponia andersonii TaxID=3476 RepID=A0A2P5DDL5_PARAD|nr:hypothetical protein PanWU01x14_074970 [Parasponia andersonii]